MIEDCLYCVIYIWGGFQNNSLKDILLLYIFWLLISVKTNCLAVGPSIGRSISILSNIWWKQFLMKQLQWNFSTFSHYYQVKAINVTFFLNISIFILEFFCCWFIYVKRGIKIRKQSPPFIRNSPLADILHLYHDPWIKKKGLYCIEGKCSMTDIWCIL